MRIVLWIVGVLFLLVFLSGFWLSRRGRPLHVGISTLHKLVSLVTGVLLLVTIFQQHRLASLDSTAWTVVGATGLCFLATVVSGGLLSSGKPMPGAVLRVYQVGPALAVLCSGATLSLVLSR